MTAPSEEGIGGPYVIGEGGTITLIGHCDGCTSFGWDLDNSQARLQL